MEKPYYQLPPSSFNGLDERRTKISERGARNSDQTAEYSDCSSKTFNSESERIPESLARSPAMAIKGTPLLPRSAQDPSRRWGFPWKSTGVFSLCLCVVFLAFQRFSHEPTQSYSKLEQQRKLATENLTYLVVGDWGRRGLYNQSEVAIQMGRVGHDLGIEFVISMGDNFYETGLKGVDDPAFTASFTDVYTAPSLQTTWYTVLGNHDYMGDALAQFTDELVERDSRWFCRREFQLNHALCRGSFAGPCNASVDMFFIDTTPFIDEYWANTTQTFDWRGLAPRAEQLESQLQNLALNLQKSNATWKIVFGHHTIRSIGHHGDLRELVDQLLPILEKNEVDMYINGHDHNLQHIKCADSSIHFFTSGGGSKSYSGLRPYNDDDGIQFAYDGQGFLAVSMMATSVSLTFYDVFGDALYSFLLEK